MFVPKKIHLIVIVVLSIALNLCAELPTLNTTNVSESVVMLQSERNHGANIKCMAIEDGLILIDCGLFTETAAKFRKDMETRFQKKTMALLLTHAHMDHFFGMGAFADVSIIAAATERLLFQRQLSIDYQSRVETYKQKFPTFDEALKTAKLSSPTQWFDKESHLGSGKSRVILRSTGGHTVGSAYALLESEGVLACGDNVQVDCFPYFGDPTGSMQAGAVTVCLAISRG